MTVKQVMVAVPNSELVVIEGVVNGNHINSPRYQIDSNTPRDIQRDLLNYEVCRFGKVTNQHHSTLFIEI